MSVITPYSDQAAAQYNLPPSVMSSIVWDMELQTPAAVNAQASALAKNLQSNGGKMDAAIAQLYTQQGKSSSVAKQKANEILTTASMPPAGSDETEETMFDKIMAWTPFGAARKGMEAGRAAGEKIQGGAWDFFTNGGVVVIGVALLVLAILANDTVRGTVVKAVTKGKA
jgi:hypothetical protein